MDGGLELAVELICNGNGLAALELCDLGVIDDGDLFLFKNTQTGANDIRVCSGQYRGHHFDNGNRLAESSEKRCKLNSDDAAAYDNEALRKLGHSKNIVGGDYVLTVDAFYGRTGGRRSRCEYQLVERNSDLLPGRLYDIHAVRVGQSSESVDDRYSMRFFEHAYAGDELFDHCGFISGHSGIIIAHIRCVHTERGGVYRLLIDFRTVKQCFGGNASAVEAGPAKLPGFDKGCLFAELSGSDSGNVPAGTAAEYSNIIIILRHIVSPPDLMTICYHILLLFSTDQKNYIEMIDSRGI